MRKILFFLIFSFFVSCKPYSRDSLPSYDYTRFELIYIDEFIYGETCTAILLDKVTGQKYLYVKSGYSGGLTKLIE